MACWVWVIPLNDFLMLSGACSDDQQCNADNQYFKNFETSPTPSATGSLGVQDSVVGVCITPVAAGKACKPGTGEAHTPALQQSCHYPAICPPVKLQRSCHA